MTSTLTYALTMMISLHITAQAATCYSLQERDLGLANSWQDNGNSSQQSILSNGHAHEILRSGRSFSLEVRRLVLESQISRGLAESVSGPCFTQPVISEAHFSTQEASMPAAQVAGGYPVLPPQIQPITITVPTFTEELQESESMSLLNIGQQQISEDRLGVVPEPSSGMLGAISLILLWRRKAP